ncbi:hypothetical protein CAP36_02215 [Chitinophagaceae bacterium IBVUCB2]|nr:hypothetical protein CAP36_02215 [Chitinophagaceae bacterium IBVUCB2]
MNEAQIHLALNHAPLFLSAFGGALLILGMFRKNNSYKKLSLYLMVLGAILTAPVFLTGEGTEEMVENLPGINETMIERHEDMAKIALVIICISGAVALIGLLFQKNAALSKLVFLAVLFLSFASFGTMAQTAHLGGLIRHSELQNTIQTGNEEGGNSLQLNKKKNTNDDD